MAGRFLIDPTAVQAQYWAMNAESSRSKGVDSSRLALRILLLASLILMLAGMQQAPATPESPAIHPVMKGPVERLIAPQPDTIGLDALLDDAGAGLDWQTMDGAVNLGYHDQPEWYRLSLRNISDQPQTRYLEIAYPLLDHVELHQIDGGMLLASHITGDRLPHHRRPLTHRTFVFPIQFEPHQQQTLLIRIQTSGSHQLPLQLWVPQVFQDRDRRDMTSRGMFYGMLLIMAVFNLFLWRTFAERSFLFFAGVQFALLSSMATLHGVTFMYLIPDFPRLHELIILVGVPLSVLFFCLFCREFLDLQQRFPAGDRLVKICIGLCAAATLGGLVLSYDVSTRISVNLIAIICLLILSIGVVRAIRGDRQGRYFVTGWFMLLLGVVGHILTLSSILSNNFLMNYAMETGAVLASLVFSFALGDRFNREREGRMEEQQARLEAMEEREQVERRLLDQARRHGPTGLPNRVALDQFLNQHLNDGERANQSLALVLFRLRGFDEINKTFGHDHSDGLLALLARRLDQLLLARDNAVAIEETKRHHHAVAHVEGYVFAFGLRLLPGEDPRPVMHELGEAIRKPLEYLGLNLSVGVNGACAVSPEQGQNAATLIRHAFIAFDQANRDVRGMAVYSPLANPYNPARLALMSDLRQAIENDDLELYFQPQMELPSGRIVAAEALLRWSHPEQGMIAPDLFIDLAEKAGLMRPLTEWVVSRALSFIQRLANAGYPLRIAVNVSPISLQDPEFADRILAAIDASGVAAQWLVVEMTESAAMADPKLTRLQLDKLQQAGVRLAIDDFGTGHSSLAYLSSLPVHEIKIDRSFVTDMLESPHNATIVRTTIDMCHALGYEVVAEGVENQATINQLSALGANLVQGYHLLRPSSGDNFVAWLGQLDQSASIPSD